MDKLSRRGLLGAAAAMAAAPAVKAAKTAGEKLNIAGVGIGAMGANYLAGCESENIAALCDVDDNYAAKTFAKYPKAVRYRDFRELLEKEKNIDAVIIGTPDHTHAVVAMAAMKAGKHVYCAKPMTHTIAEARLLAKTARDMGVATQMSVQSCASDPALTTAEWVQSGVLGPVREVHVWSDRPVWPQGIDRPTDTPPVPKGFDWNLWLGPAPERPYNPVYHPFNWRGWTDFGTGALGDMGCHTLHVIVTALALGAPVAVQASTSFQMVPAPPEKADQSWMRARKIKHPETYPDASIVTWDFAARPKHPPVRVHWYDGGIRPPRPVGMDPGTPIEGDGILFVGDRGVLVSGFSGGVTFLSAPNARDFVPAEKKLPRSIGHYKEWILAAKGGKPANCNFEFGALLTEIALLGVIAQRTGKSLAWDAETGEFTNYDAANKLLSMSYRSGWSI
jgi:predicted dehydrogenase